LSTAYSNYSKYLETEYSSADPGQTGLHCSIVARFDANGRGATAPDRNARSGSVLAKLMRALEILRELSRSLDPEYGQISRPLSDLYAYMQTRLIEANSKQIDPPLAEVEQLLSTLLEGWKAVSSPRPPVAPRGLRTDQLHVLVAFADRSLAYPLLHSRVPFWCVEPDSNGGDIVTIWLRH